MTSLATIVFVISFNFSLAIVCLFVAGKLWQLRRTLAGISLTLSDVERNIYNIFHPAPEAIIKGQIGIHNLKSGYQSKQIQLQQIRQILTLIDLISRACGQNLGNSWSRLGRKNKKKSRSLNTI